MFVQGFKVKLIQNLTSMALPPNTPFEQCYIETLTTYGIISKV